MTIATLIRRPSAYLPLLMSLAALALVLGHVALFGIVRGTDESAAARLFQLLIVAQLPIVAFFAINWLPKAPRAALAVLAMQMGAVLLALAPVLILEP